MKKNITILLLLFTGFINAQIISQYIETNSGTTPKGVEIFNNTGAVLNFASNNLVIEQGTNGQAPEAKKKISSGTLAIGDVIVIGTSDLEATVIGNGAMFFSYGFQFNGDDALVIKYGGVITDVFGTAGSDPGSAWSANGVSSKNQNIRLKAGILVGDLDGWTDPSLRFETVNTNPSGTNGKEGFGDPAPLPVELTTFSASIVDENVHLNWETATEVNNFGFDIERKVENKNWTKVDFVNGHGNSNSQKYYSYTDNSIENSGKYIYRLKQLDIDGKYDYSETIEVNFETPNIFELIQNYPNPFNPSTTIRFSIPLDTHVKLSVYNTLGEKVSELVNGNLAAGQHYVNFNASKLNSGIYFYKIESKNYTEIKKMMLLK